jgi:asparagine synthase (glutamine-hydrolysing)
MCGIAGIVAVDREAAPPGRDALVRMACALSHRGPDELGLYRDNRAGLAHARLSIIDLSTGQQPLAGADKSWIVFNGEIFNYVELRNELIERGYRFQTKSDTEVIVHAYAAWGDAAFQRMNGQWAVAIWNSDTGRLVLSRDRLGICPLYLCRHRDHLYFASEVKAIFAADAGIPRDFDAKGIDQTFTFWSVVPPQSVFRGVTELEPGHICTIENKTVNNRRYWAPKYDGVPDFFRGSVHEALEKVRSSLDGATALRMLRADVPVGSYLSGGLDSSLVAALGQRFAGNRFRTFSLRFDDAEYDESQFQRLMVSILGSEHHDVVVSRRDIAQVFPQVIYHSERPILRTAPAPLFLLSKLVRSQGIKVVLTGEGADEMFAGYDLFREGKVRRFWGRQADSRWRPRLLERLYPYLQRSPVAQQALARQFFGRDLAQHGEAGFAHGPRWSTTTALKRLFSRDMQANVARHDAIAELLTSLPAEFRTWSYLAQDQYIEIRTLLSGYLLSSQGDRMLMANSVEGRFPFLDDDVVTLANSLPATYKLRVLDEKHILKKVAEGIVPREIINRKKQPYRAPDALSFVAADAPEYIEEALSPHALQEANVFAPQLVAQLLAKCRKRDREGQFSNADNMALVGVLSTQLLYQQMIAKPPAPATEGAIFRTDVDKATATRV